MEEQRKFFLVFILFSSLIACRCHNITQILASDPSYSDFNKQLSITKLADEINSRSTITVLVLSNSNVASLSKYSESAMKNILSLLVVLDYFDEDKLKKISNRTSIVTTLYQTSGIANGNEGFLNITDLKNGQVAFGSAIRGSDLTSNFVKNITSLPYNISVVEISAPVIVPSMVSALAPSSSASNLTQILNKNGCRNFSSLISSTGVITDYESALSSGLTVFAFTDAAFNGPQARDLKKLNGPDLSTVLRYHATPSYNPLGTLKTVKGSIDTIATRGSRKYKLKPSSAAAAGGVTLSTGVDSAKIIDTALDAIPVSIFTIDNVLLPVELFGKNKSESPAPAPSPEAADTPLSSPPAPATTSPDTAPVESPDSADVPNSGCFSKKPKWAAAATTAAVVFGLQWLS